MVVVVYVEKCDFDLYFEYLKAKRFLGYFALRGQLLEMAQQFVMWIWGYLLARTSVLRWFPEV